MKTIYKYRLPMSYTGDYVNLELPKGAFILNVGMQPDRYDRGVEYLQLWALVDEPPLVDANEAPPEAYQVERRRFAIVGTGTPAPETYKGFLGTVLLFQGSLVLHVFELL